MGDQPGNSKGLKQVMIVDPAEVNEQVKKELTSPKFRWLATVLTVANAGVLVDMMLEPGDAIVYSPVMLRGKPAWVLMILSMIAWLTMSMINWRIWLRDRRKSGIPSN